MCCCVLCLLCVSAVCVCCVCVCCVCLLCVCLCVGPRFGCSPETPLRRTAPPPDRPSAGPPLRRTDRPSAGPPTISLFFFPLPPHPDHNTTRITWTKQLTTNPVYPGPHLRSPQRQHVFLAPSLSSLEAERPLQNLHTEGSSHAPPNLLWEARGSHIPENPSFS